MPPVVQAASLRPLPFSLSSAYRAVHLLSFDVVFGIVGAGWLASRVAGTRLPAAWWAVLGLTAWIVYALDHLADTRRRGREPGSELHRGFVRYRAPLLGAVAVAIGLDLALAPRLPSRLLLAGLPFAALSLGYLALAQWRRCAVPKELGATLLYTSALWFAPLWALPAGSLSTRGWEIGLIVTAHAAAALANLLFLSLREEAADRRDAQRSWVIEHGRTSAGFALQLAAGAGLAAGVAALAAASSSPARLAAISFGLLASWPLLLRRCTGAVPPEAWRVRALSDFGFLLLWLPAWMA